MLEELFSADILLFNAFLGQLFHHLDLGGDGSVIGAGQPQGRIALHAVIAGQCILQGAVHGMAHMQLAGDVGRGHHDGKGLLARHAMGGKRAAFLPMAVGFILDRLGIILLFHVEFFRHCSRSFQKNKSRPNPSAWTGRPVVPPCFAAEAAASGRFNVRQTDRLLGFTCLPPERPSVRSPQAVFQPMNRSLCPGIRAYSSPSKGQRASRVMRRQIYLSSSCATTATPL